MARRTVELTGVVGNGSDGVKSVILPIGLDYMTVNLVVDSGTVTAAQVTDMKVYANSDMIRNYSGSDQDNMNQFDRLTAMGGTILRIPFEMIGMKRPDQQYATTLATGLPDPINGKVIATSRIEWTTTGGGAPVFRVFAEVDDSLSGPGAIIRIKKYTDTLAGTSEQGFGYKIPFGTSDIRFWRRLFWSVTAGATTQYRLLVGTSNSEYMKRTKALNTRILADGVKTLGASFDFVMDTTELGISEMIDTMIPTPKGLNSIGVMDPRITASAAATVTFLHETVGEL